MQSLHRCLSIDDRSDGCQQMLFESTHSVDVVEDDIEDSEQWSDEPNGGQIDECEDQRPNQCQRDGDYGGDYAVEPESGGVEEQISEAPHKLKAFDRQSDGY